jgi:hypothetical protein
MAALSMMDHTALILRLTNKLTLAVSSHATISQVRF